MTPDDLRQLDNLLKSETPPQIPVPEDRAILDQIFEWMLDCCGGMYKNVSRESECIEYDDDGERYEVVVRRIGEAKNEP